MPPLELTRSGIAGTLVVFAVVAVCIRLGFWQLDRRQQRLERNAAIAERLAEPPLTLAAPPADTTGLTYRRATFGGAYDNPRTLVLAGRSLGGVPGVHIFAPLRTSPGALEGVRGAAGGTAGGTAILVNRGWLPSRDAATVDLGGVAVDTPVVATGVLLPLPDTDTERPAGGFRTTWFRLDADAVRGQYPYTIAPLYLQVASASGAPSGPAAAAAGPVPVEPPALDAGPHLSYALQWFGFASVFLVGWAALVMRGGGNTVRRPALSGGGSEPGGTHSRS